MKLLLEFLALGFAGFLAWFGLDQKKKAEKIVAMKTAGDLIDAQIQKQKDKTMGTDIADIVADSNKRFPSDGSGSGGSPKE